MRCPRCGCDRGRLGPGKGPHVASWVCERCGRWLAWVAKRDLDDLTHGDLADALNRWAKERRL
jgi:hypothetical protein